MELSVILVEPKYAGNTGSVARLMKNFGIKNLMLVNPSFSIESDECRKYAVHAQEILDNVMVVDVFEEVVKQMDYLAGTTSIDSISDNHHLRKALPAHTFAEEVHKLKGNIGIAFGREDYGMFNEELKRCDTLIRIPTSDVYPCLNLSQAVCIVLYEIFVSKYRPRKFVQADRLEKEKLYEFFDEMLSAIDYTDYKRENTSILFRRIIGRSMLSKWEFHTLMGVFKKAVQAGKYRKSQKDNH